jgi:DNA-binding NarL/FixJ family response regulator
METSAHPIRVFLVDDHPIVREGLKTLVMKQADMTVVGEAGDGVGLVARVKSTAADVVVMDVAMPQVGGQEAAVALKSVCPDVKIIAFSAHEERPEVERMLAAGASGYVGKLGAADELVRAIRCVARGETYLDPAAAGAIVGRLRPDGPALSEREEGVLRRIAAGFGPKEIAAELGVSVRTVETYRARAMEKMNLASRADVVRFAIEHRWMSKR